MRYELDEDKASWRKFLTEEFQKNRHFFENIESINPPDLDAKFDDSYGAEEGEPFCLWTKDWVYFPVCYDGAEWVGSVPRNPRDSFEPWHFGGG